ncbi:MAG: DUF488 family protein [Beijerinckiaceae bacterium]
MAAWAAQRRSAGMWPKEIGPSPELREWFGHDPARYVEFAHCYRAELARGNAILSHAADTADLNLMGMGAYDHSRTREELFGGTTRTHVSMTLPRADVALSRYRREGEQNRHHGVNLL